MLQKSNLQHTEVLKILEELHFFPSLHICPIVTEILVLQGKFWFELREKLRKRNYVLVCWIAAGQQNCERYTNFCRHHFAFSGLVFCNVLQVCF